MRGMEAAGLKTFAATGLLWEDYNAVYNRAKIALVKSVHGDVAQRVFENMAQGCCVLADRAPDAERLGFWPGVEYAAYADSADAVTGARCLIESGQWKDIAERGAQAVKPHTWMARAQTLLDTIRGVSQ